MLSVVITLTGGVALAYLPVAQYPRISPPGISVSIAYPGASAQTVADTVAAPIEQQVNGVPGMLYMSSQMGNDGSYSLSITFDVSVDLNTALVMVQNRVTTAMPLLPSQVQNQGITIRKKTPDMLLMINFLSERIVKTTDGRTMTAKAKAEDADTITLIDATGREQVIARADIASNEPVYNDIFLSNYALINIKDELLRVEGVSDVSIMGERDYSFRIWLDAQQMASRSVTAMDVATAIRSQNIQAAAGQTGSPPLNRSPQVQLPLDTLGRLAQVDEFRNIILKVGPGQPPTPALSGGAAASPGGAMGAPNRPPAAGSGDIISEVTAVSGDSTPTTSSGGATTGGGADTSGGATTTGGASSGGGATLTTMTTTAPTIKQPSAARTTKAAPKKAPANAAPLSTSDGVVRLKDVARVEMGATNYNMSCTFDGGPAVGVTVYQLPDSNALDVGDRVRAKMEELKTRFPAGLYHTIAYDTTPFIRESIDEVFHTLRDAVILVALVVLLFLQDWRAMILPMIDVPVSLIGTFAVMAVMGYSLNNISLFGLVLAIGIVVDDAIVVLENIERQMARGHDPRTATIRAMAEISGPILAITLVLCAVFVPCAFISGITGRFFRQFAVTIAASTVISAINALTMTPSRALVIFKSHEGDPAGHIRKPEALPWWIFGLLGMLTMQWGPALFGEPLGLPTVTELPGGIPMPRWQQYSIDAIYFIPGMLVGLVIGWFANRPVNAVLGFVFRNFNRAFDKMTAAYGITIGGSLRMSLFVLLAYGGLLVFTYSEFRSAPAGFVPQQDMGRLMVSVQLPDSSSLERTQAVVAQVDQIIRETPGVAHSIGLGGISFVNQANASNFGSLFVILDPFAKRQSPELKDEAIMARLRKRFAKVDASVVVFGSSPIPGVSSTGGFRVMVEDRGGLGLDTLQAQSDQFVANLQGDSYKVTDKVLAGLPHDVADKLEPFRDELLSQQQLLDKLKTALTRPEDLHHEAAIIKLSRWTEIGLKDVSTQFRSATPQYFMSIDRTKVASLGVALEDVNTTLEMFLGSLYVNSFNEFGRHWQVTVQGEPQFRSTDEQIKLLQVRNNQGQMVPLSTLVKLSPRNGPLFVKRYNLYTAAPITGSLLPGVSSGTVIQGVDRIADESLPRSMKAEWTELMFMQIREGNTTAIVFLFAVVSVFLALAALYESWTLPLAVILVVPLCVLCSLMGILHANQVAEFLDQLGLMRLGAPGQRQFGDSSVNIFVQIGLVVLVGLACKNAILVVEFAKELHVQGGKSVFEATVEASRMRLRPILMTSFAFILGVVPLCLASGAGAEMRKSLGVAVFSGMLGVTLFGIFLTPVFFYVIQGIGEARLFSGAPIQWLLSCLTGGGVGAATGYLVARLGIVGMLSAVVIGAAAGVLAVLAARGIRRTLTR